MQFKVIFSLAASIFSKENNTISTHFGFVVIEQQKYKNNGKETIKANLKQVESC